MKSDADDWLTCTVEAKVRELVISRLAADGLYVTTTRYDDDGNVVSVEELVYLDVVL